MRTQRLRRRSAMSGGVATVAAALADCQLASSQSHFSMPSAPKDATDHPFLGLDDAHNTSPHAPFRATFLAWLGEASTRFALPVSPILMPATYTELRVRGLHPAIWIALTQNWSINVGVEWDGVFWDLLASMDVTPTLSPDGSWENAMLIPEARSSYPTREAIWRVDGFEALLTWINGKLAPATHVGVWRASGRGCTWARLIRDGADLRTGRPLTLEDPPDHLLALHGHP